MSYVYWIGTYNDQSLTPDSAKAKLEQMFTNDNVTNIIGQMEKGQSGNLHIQYGIRLQAKQRMSWLKSNLCNQTHWERAKGNPTQLKEYVTKTETRQSGPWEWGLWPTVGGGRRTDLVELKEDLDGGADDITISEQHFEAFLRYRRGITEYRLLHLSPRRWEMEVRILWGNPGTGKTRNVYERGDSSNLRVYPLAQNYAGGVIWWDGYVGQEIILIDDFYGWIPFSYLLRLLDRYPMHVRINSGHVQFSSTIIYITSNKPIDEWYPNINDTQLMALKRRITSIQHFEL